MTVGEKIVKLRKEQNLTQEQFADMLKVSRQSVSKLIAKDAPCVDGYICTEDDIRYALPEYLFDIGNVERAIELAKDDLVNKYGLIDPDTLLFKELLRVA